MSDTLLTPRFHLRGSSINAWRDSSGGTPSQLKSASSGVNCASQASSDTGAFGSTMIAMASATVIRALAYPGFSNWSDVGSFSVLCRIIPRFSGAPVANQALVFLEEPSTSVIGVWLYIDTAGKMFFSLKDQYGTSYLSGLSTAAYIGWTSGTAVDVLATWDGTTNAATYYINGTAIGTLNAAAGSPSINNQLFGTLTVGVSPSATLSNYDLNELAIWNYALSGTDITNLTNRVTFLASSSFDGTSYTDPGIANVRSTTSYTFAGVSQTGTCAVPTASQVLTGIPVDATTGNVVLPAAAQVLNGVAFGASSGTTGTVVQPVAATVLTGVAYGPSSGTTGTLAVPTVPQIVSGIIPFLD